MSVEERPKVEEEGRQSGAMISEVCQRHHTDHAQFYSWDRIARQGASEALHNSARKSANGKQAWHIDLTYLWVRGQWYLLVNILDSFSRHIVHWQLVLSVRAKEIAGIIATALERVPGKRPRISRDKSPKFVAKEWREVMRHFELEEIPIRVRHPESDDRIENYHRSIREEAFADTEAKGLYRARDLLAEWLTY